MKDDAIYIARPSRRRYLGFGLMTVACLAVVGGVWFYMMQNLIVDAATGARDRAQEMNQVVEDFQRQQSENQGLAEIIQELGEILKPATAPADNQANNQATMEAAAALLKDKVIAEIGVPATSDQTP